MSKKESLITLIEGFYRLLVNQYKTLTKCKMLYIYISRTVQRSSLSIVYESIGNAIYLFLSDADDSGLESPLLNMQPRDFEIHGPIE